jgi:hypothetical protein
MHATNTHGVPRVHVVAVATCTQPELAYLLISAHRAGVTPVLLGLGDARLSFVAREYSVKLEHVRKWLHHGLKVANTLEPHDLVVHVDAFDVVLQGGADAIRQGWQSAGSPPVLVSVEKTLFPRTDLRPVFDAANPDTPYRYLNSGTYMGTAQALLDLLQTPEAQGKGDDQGKLQAAWAAHRHRLGIQLDTKHRVFYVLMLDTLRQALASTAPIVHFNGRPSRAILKQYFQAKFPDALQPDVDTTFWRDKAKALAAAAASASASSATVLTQKMLIATAPVTIGLATAVAVLVVACIVLVVLLTTTQAKAQPAARRRWT